MPFSTPTRGAAATDISTATAAATAPVAAASLNDKAGDSRDFRAILALVGVGFFIQTIATDSGIASLPLRLLLKNHLHLNPTAVAGFLTVANIAWYCKPLAGAFADTVTIRGSRYRNYLLLGAAGAALFWILSGVVSPTYSLLLAMFIGVNVMLMLISTVLGGYMVLEGRRFQATGRLSSFRNTSMNAVGLIAGPAAGWLATRSFGLTTGINAGLLVLLLFFVLRTVNEPAAAADVETGLAAAGRKLKTQYAPLLRARGFWSAVAMTFLVTAMPGFGTLLLYYQTDVLKLTPQFIGNIGIISGVMSIVGGLSYMLLCRKLTLRAMLALSIVVSSAAALLYLFYQGTATIIAIEATAGLLLTLPSIALMDLAARATPKGGESMAYSVLMAVYNLGGRMGDFGGSYLHDRFHLSLHQLIYVSATTTLVTLIAVPFLPKAVVGTPDGAALTHASEVSGEETPDV